MLFNRLQVVIDAVIIVISYIAGYNLRFSPRWYDDSINHLPMSAYNMYLILIVPMFLLLYYQYDLYSSRRMSGRKKELFSIIQANSIGVLVFIVFMYVVHQNDISRGVLAIFWVVDIGWLLCLEKFMDATGWDPSTPSGRSG